MFVFISTILKLPAMKALGSKKKKTKTNKPIKNVQMTDILFGFFTES